MQNWRHGWLINDVIPYDGHLDVTIDYQAVGNGWLTLPYFILIALALGLERVYGVDNLNIDCVGIRIHCLDYQSLSWCTVFMLVF